MGREIPQNAHSFPPVPRRFPTLLLFTVYSTLFRRQNAAKKPVKTRLFRMLQSIIYLAMLLKRWRTLRISSAKAPPSLGALERILNIRSSLGATLGHGSPRCPALPLLPCVARPRRSRFRNHLPGILLRLTADRFRLALSGGKHFTAFLNDVLRCFQVVQQRGAQLIEQIKQTVALLRCARPPAGCLSRPCTISYMLLISSSKVAIVSLPFLCGAISSMILQDNWQRCRHAPQYPLLRTRINTYTPHSSSGTPCPIQD